MQVEVLAISAVLGVLVPLAILFGRFAVRRQRQATLLHLRDTLKRTTGQDAALFPSFEFALQKYGLEPGASKRSSAIEVVFFSCTAGIFMLLSAAGFSMLLGQLGPGRADRYRPVLGGFQSFPLNETAVTNYEMLTVDVIAIAFLGAYIWSIQYLIRRISVFDLSATSFLRITGQIILAASTATVLRHLIGDVTVDAEWSVNVLLCAAFLIGFFPSAGLDLLVRRIPQLRVKNLDKDAVDAFRVMPVEMIDGIDSQVSFRLAERDVIDVANLATENPVLLCAETPYSLFQAIDWIAQAQLASEVGPKKFRQLRDMGCRTILALEAAAANEDKERSLLSVLSQDVADPPKTLAAHVLAMKANPHVQRLCLIREVLDAAMRKGASGVEASHEEKAAETADPTRDGLAADDREAA
jgi:hypothetical protein